MEQVQYRVRVFGTTGVRIDGSAMHLTANMRRTLALIVAAGPDGLSIDRAITEAADGDNSPKAQSRVRMDVSRLRKRIGAELLPKAAGMWRLDIDPLHVDYFALLSTRNEHLPPPEQLTKLLHGVAFNDAHNTPLIGNAQETTATTRLELLRRMTNEPASIDSATLQATRALLDNDPINEDLIEVVVEHHLVANQVTGAREILSNAAVNFHEMLGIELPGTLRAFEDQVGAIHPQLPGSGAPEPASGPGHPTDSLVGREAESAAIGTWLEAEQPAPLMLVGPSGFGKSTLLNTAIADAQSRDAAVFTAVGRQFDSRPYAAFATILGTDFAQLVTNEETTPTEVWSAAITTLTSTRHARTVLTVDDAQWLDSLSRDLVLFLLRNRHPAVRIALVGRPTDPGVWESLERATRSAGAEPLTLGPLSPEATEALVARRFPNVGLAIRRRLAREVHAASDGVPAIAVRLLDHAHGPTLSLPDGAQTHGLEWFARGFTPEETQVGLAAAVLGARTSYPELAALAGLDDQALLAALELLGKKAVFAPDPVPGRITFAHALVRAAFLDVADAADVQALQRRAADLVNDPHRRAQLLELSAADSEPALAAAALRDSAELHLASGAVTEAVRAFESADTLDPDGSSASILADWAGALDRMGLDGAVVRQRAFDSAMHDGSLDAAVAAAVSGLPEGERPAGDPERIALLEEIDPTLLFERTAFIHASNLCRQYAVAGRAQEALKLYDAAAANAESFADFNFLSRAKWLASFSSTTPAQRLDDPTYYPTNAGGTPTGDANQLQAIDTLGVARAADAATILAGWKDTLDPATDTALYWHALMFEATVLAAQGQRDQAKAASDAALDFGVAYGVREAGSAWVAQSFADKWMFEENGAARFFEQLGDFAGVEVEDSFLAQTTLALGLYQQGHVDDARALAESLIEFALPHHSFAGIATLAVCSRITHADSPHTDEMIAALERFAGSLIVIGGGFVCLGPADVALAYLTTGEQRQSYADSARALVSADDLAGWNIAVEREMANLLT